MDEANTEWMQVDSAAELNAGDSVRVVNENTGSAVIDTATVRDALEGVGTVNLATTSGRTREVRFQDDGRVKVRGECFSYVLEVEREVATDGGEAAEAEGREEGEAVAVAYRTARTDDLKVEEGEVQEEAPYQHRTLGDDEVCVAVQRDGSAVYLRVPLHGGNVYALHHATQRHDVRQGSLVGLADAEAVEHSMCMNCEEWLDHTVPVNTGYGTTGDSGCPHCHDADPVRAVVHEVGDRRGVLGGYVRGGQRSHGGSVTLEAARQIVGE